MLAASIEKWQQLRQTLTSIAWPVPNERYGKLRVYVVGPLPKCAVNTSRLPESLSLTGIA
jgi:hypothetical protein